MCDATATTWALAAGAAATDAAEPARIDVAALSDKIAGMMTARFMRMIPPCIYLGQQPASWPSGPDGASLGLPILPVFGCSMHYDKPLYIPIQISNVSFSISLIFYGKYSFISYRKVLVTHAGQGSVQFASQGGGTLRHHCPARDQ